MSSRISKVDVILILVAFLAVVGLGAFFMYITEEQQQQQQQVQQEGAQQFEQMKEQEELVVARKEIALSYKPAEGILLTNRSAVSLDVSGFQVKLNETLLEELTEGTVLAPGESYSISLIANGEKAMDIVTVNDGDGVLLYQYILSEIEEDVDEPKFSVLSGFYDIGFDLSLTASEGAKIYYTTDGTMPSTQSKLYTEPIKVINRAGEAPVFAAKRGITASEYVPEDIDKCTIVKAIAVDANGNVSDVKTGIYFVGLSSKLMYANIPIMVLQADEEALFDYFEGIFVGGVDYENALASGLSTNGKGNYYRGNMTDVSIAMFDRNQNLMYMSDGEMGVVADAQVAMGQKSMALVADEKVPESSFVSGIFYKEDAEVLLNNGKTDYSIKMRQLFVQKIAEEMGIEYSVTMPCVVFLNGEYWGVYLLEGDSKAAISKKYGMTPENVEKNIAVGESHTNASFQEVYDYIITNDMAVDEYYDYVCQRVDTVNYADYVCLNMYISNAGYGERMEMWRDAGGGKWRFILPDVSSSMGIGSVNSFSINSFLYPGVSGDKMLQALMCNDQFKELLKQRMDNLIKTMEGGELIAEFLSGEASVYRKPIVASFNRFIRSMSDSGYDSNVQVISSFLMERKAYIEMYTQEYVAAEYKFEPVVEEADKDTE